VVDPRSPAIGRSPFSCDNLLEAEIAVVDPRSPANDRTPIVDELVDSAFFSPKNAEVSFVSEIESPRKQGTLFEGDSVHSMSFEQPKPELVNLNLSFTDSNASMITFHDASFTSAYQLEEDLEFEEEQQRENSDKDLNGSFSEMNNDEQPEDNLKIDCQLIPITEAMKATDLKSPILKKEIQQHGSLQGQKNAQEKENASVSNGQGEVVNKEKEGSRHDGKQHRDVLGTLSTNI